MAQPSGALWGSVACPSPLPHADWRSRDQTIDVPISERPTLPPEPQLVTFLSHTRADGAGPLFTSSENYHIVYLGEWPASFT